MMVTMGPAIRPIQHILSAGKKLIPVRTTGGAAEANRGTFDDRTLDGPVIPDGRRVIHTASGVTHLSRVVFS